MFANADIPQEVKVYVGPSSNTGDPLALGNKLIWDSRKDNECVGTTEECAGIHAELIETRLLHTVDGLDENVGIGASDEDGSYDLMRVLVVNRSSPQDDAVYSGATRSVTLIDDWNDPPGHLGRVEHEVTHDFIFEHLFDLIEGDETQGISEGIAIIMQSTTEPPIVVREPETDNWEEAIAQDPHEAGVHIYHAYKRLATAIGAAAARKAFLDAIRNFEDSDEDMDASAREFLGAVIGQVDSEEVIDVLEAFHELDLFPSPSELRGESGDEEHLPETGAPPSATAPIGAGLNLSNFVCFYLPEKNTTRCVHKRYVRRPGD